MTKGFKTVRFHLTISEELDQKLLEWRKAQPGYMNRSDAVRKMIELVVAKEEEK